MRVGLPKAAREHQVAGLRFAVSSSVNELIQRRSCCWCMLVDEASRKVSDATVVRAGQKPGLNCARGRELSPYICVRWRLRRRLCSLR